MISRLEKAFCLIFFTILKSIISNVALVNCMSPAFKKIHIFPTLTLYWTKHCVFFYCALKFNKLFISPWNKTYQQGYWNEAKISITTVYNYWVKTLNNIMNYGAGRFSPPSSLCSNMVQSITVEIQKYRKLRSNKKVIKWKTVWVSLSLNNGAKNSSSVQIKEKYGKYDWDRLNEGFFMRLHRSIRNWIITLPKKDSRNYITS